MTAAFNLSQLANGANTSGQLNASSYLYNQVPVANGGTALSSAGAAGNMLIASSASAYSAVAMPTFGFRNRIINGDMRIDQRNAGAAVTPTTSSVAFPVDRWASPVSQSSKFSVQQNAGAVTPPAGYSNYLGVTSLSAYSVTASDYFALWQPIEGFNCADFAWGTANAQTVTLSFWVRSSLTGTFGGALENSAQTRAYPFTYTISAANTWEQKSVVIAGDTTGTWLTNNGVGIYVTFGLGAGSTYSGTAGAWTASQKLSATGAVSVVGTNGATFYVTGVQLEKGSVATAFDVRPYGTELSLCQRYYEKSYDTGVAVGAATLAGAHQSIASTNYLLACGTVRFAAAKRAVPTVTLYSTQNTNTSGVATEYNVGGVFVADRSAGAAIIGASSFFAQVSGTATASNDIRFSWTVSAEL